MPVYHHEHSVLVASTKTDQVSNKKFIEDHIDEIINRGEYARVCIVTGTHGSKSGNDGINDISCLKDSRKFYDGWVGSFGLSPEAEDPRIYEEGGKVVTGINPSILAPNWAGRKPTKVHQKWPKMKEALVEVQIIDVGFYHNKPDELIQVLRDYNPSTLILDWCYTRQGQTYKLLTSSGLISQIILEN